MGILSPLGQNLSLALGSSEVNLLELTDAYAVFDDRGIHNDPITILRVEDRSGTVLEKNTPHPVEVLSEETAAVMTSMLESVIDHGTGYPAAGKTGTMDEYMDAWFVGFVPSLVAGVWVGYDEKRPIGPGMTGARAALPAWTDFMMEVTRGRPADGFPQPAGTVTRLVCAESGMLATDACPHVTNETYNAGSEPTEYCTQHPGAPLEPTSPESTPPADEAPPPGNPTAPTAASPGIR